MKYSLRSAGRFTTRKQYALHAVLSGIKEVGGLNWLRMFFVLVFFGLFIIGGENETIEYVQAIEATSTPPAVASSTPVIIEVRVNWTPERIEQEVRETFPESPNTAVAVAKSESGHLMKPTAYNPEWHRDRHGNRICQGSYGVMQIACVHMIHDPEALFDVETNLAVARKIKDSEGWKPWGGYTSGNYKKHL